MFEYRIYLLDHYGHIFHTEAFTSMSDTEAMANARKLSGGATVEIWHYDRVVGRIPSQAQAPHVPTAAPAAKRAKAFVH
jgi:hypothetical protein